MSVVPFQNIPQNLRTPLFFAELSNADANTNQQNQVTLIVGQMTASGTATPNVPVSCSGPGDAIAKAGAGSMLALEVAAYCNADDFGEVWILPLQDAGGAVAATGSISFTGPVTTAGVLSLYIAACAGSVTGLPSKISVPLTAGMTAAQVATAVAAAIEAAANMPVTAVVDGTTTSKVDLTAVNKGLAAGDIDIRINYLGTAGGEATPAGLTVTITPMAGGATNPTLTTALANLVDHPYDFIVNPYSDPTSTTALTALLSDKTGRWSWQSQVYGGVFGAYRSTYGGLGTFGTSLNDQHTSFMGFYDSPSPAYVWAAAVTGSAAASLRVDPALPLQTLQIPGVLAPPIPSRFSLSMRNALLFDGISTFTVDATGAVFIENLITTYQLNSSGQPDDSYLQVETLYTLMAVLRTLKSVVTSTFARVKLVSNGTRIPAGSNFVTPNTIRAALIAQYQAMSPALVQDVADFSAGLVVQQNATNPSRVDVLYDPILTGGVRVFALLAQFQLAAPASTSS